MVFDWVQNEFLVSNKFENELKGMFDQVMLEYFGVCSEVVCSDQMTFENILSYVQNWVVRLKWAQNYLKFWLTVKRQKKYIVLSNFVITNSPIKTKKYK